ncbi:diguanylate cyclase (GGDEF)-like protein [Anoxybacillus calidus]|uniref:Diguanylate cyclase (GGDEF)-like protein n=1 Tax=[Anoxybacillus] calidus TaxID=575178 RepID=A0A7W0BWZ8_9BACL|nr:diguanylate cyclase [Anoxybacillus calidus]MBA2871766.1 diguanylate cyclase (GGDEF)-like protein [Anoxybacillus calidus]
MEGQEEKLYRTFKEKFFDWFLTYDDYEDISQVMLNLLLLIKQELMVKEVSFFMFDPLKNVFFLEVTTAERERLINSTISYDVFKLENGAELPFKIRESSLGITIELLLRTTDELLGVLQVINDEKERFSEKFLLKIREDCMLLFEKMKNLSRGLSEEKKYERLHRFTAKIHASMKINDVLEEVIRTLQEIYPSFTFHLLLSHDNQNHDNLPIKMLAFEGDEENMAAMQAYVTGQIQIEEAIKPQRSIIYAPIKGVQGVYGVLEIIAPHIKMFSKNEINFISLLANTAGSALENAKLYEQSRRLIADLQLINETMHRLNTNLRFQDAIEFMVEQIQRSFGAEEVGFLLFDGQRKRVLQGSTPFFHSSESKSYIDFVVKRIQNEREIVFLGNVKIHSSSFIPAFRSLMAVPMVQSSVLKGIAIVLHREPYYFTFEMYKLLQSLIHHSTLVFTNAMLREELERLVVTDRLTNLYARHHLDEQITRSMEQDSYGSFILVDIDNFKTINDTYGHQVGDEVLIQVANIIKANIRESDIGARWGGEELAIYLPRASLTVGISVANRLVEKIRKQTNPRVTISCGVSYWKKNRTDSMIELFKRADEALYTAKKTGKNCVVVQDYHRRYKV